MLTFRPLALLALATGLALTGCSDYGRYGYGGVSVGYGSGYYRPYYGWYDGYYYPGRGYYVYDRWGSRYRWSDRYRDYWQARPAPRGYRENWSEYRREYRRDRRDDRREWRRDRRGRRD